MGRLAKAARRFAGWSERAPLALSILALLIAAATSWLMASVAGLAAVEAVMSRFKPQWLAIVLGARFAAYAGYALAHGATLAGETGTRIPTNKRLKLVAFGASATSLRGGFSIDRRAMRHAGATQREATVRVLSLGALEWATLAPVAWVCALTLIGTPHVRATVTIPWAVGVPAGTVLAALAAWRLSPRSLARKGALGRALGRTIEALLRLPAQLRDPLRGGAGMLGMGLYWAAEIASLWAALRAFDVHASLAIATLGYATGHVLTPRTLPLSGAGITEVLLPLGLSWLGLPLAAAVPAVIVYRIGLLTLSIPPALLARADVQRLVGTRRVHAG